jgi:hypothetical protein
VSKLGRAIKYAPAVAEAFAAAWDALGGAWSRMRKRRREEAQAASDAVILARLRKAVDAAEKGARKAAADQREQRIKDAWDKGNGK